MTDGEQKSERASILDDNIERLLAVAPEPARLSEQARARILAALRAPAAGHVTTDAAPALRLIRRPAAAMVAIAAAVTLFVVGLQVLTSTDGAGSDVDVAAGGDDPGSGAADGPRAGDPAEDGRGAAAGVDTGDDPGAIASVGAGDGRRLEAGSEDTDPSDTTGGAEAPASETAAGSDPIPGVITLDGTIEALPETVVVWVKPMVDLPRVADPTDHEVALTALEEGGAAGFVLTGALGPARALGARQVLVQIDAPGAAPARALVAVEDAERAPVAFTLTAGVRVDGFVVDARTGTPVGGAVVVALDQLPMDAILAAPESVEGYPRPWTTTDANGAFSLGHVAASPSVQIRASHPGFAPSTRTTSLDGAAAEPLRIELPQGGAFVGTCEREDGTRWEGALVVASSLTVDPTLEIRTAMNFGMGHADANGTYRIADLPPGPYVVLLFGSPASRAEGPIKFTQAVLGGAEDVAVDFLSRGSTAGESFTGTLVDHEGTPLPGVTLTLMRVDEGTTERNNWRATETSADGSFAFTDIDSGSHVLHSASESFKRMELVWSGDISGPTERTITIPRTQWTITCRGADDGEPRADAWVVVEYFDPEQSDWIYGGRGTTDATGALSFPSLPPGRYRAHVSSVKGGDGHALGEDVTLSSGPATRSVIDVPAGGHLVVRALDRPGGSPLENVTIRVRDAAGVIVPQTDTLATNADGLARSLAVAFGDVEILVEFPDGTERVIPHSFQTGGAGQSIPLDVVLEPR